MKINSYQIENANINSVFLHFFNKDNQKEKLDLNENIEYFSQIEESILNKNETLEMSVEIEVIPFGKSDFEDEDGEKKEEELYQENKERYVDQKGNIFFILEGLRKKIKKK